MIIKICKNNFNNVTLKYIILKFLRKIDNEKVSVEKGRLRSASRRCAKCKIITNKADNVKIDNKYRHNNSIFICTNYFASRSHIKIWLHAGAPLIR